MSTIGIIDDRADIRTGLADAVSIHLPDGWQAIDSAPLSSLDEYASWIGTNKIVALILDERLDEVSATEGAVHYQGHDLLKYLRSTLQTLPVFVITAWSSDSALQERFGDADEILDRGQFNKHRREYVERIVRASQRYLDTFRAQLNTISTYAEKVSRGDSVKDEERDSARAAQTQLGAPFSVELLDSRNEGLSYLQELIDKFESVKAKIEKAVNNQGDELEKGE